MTYPEVIPPPPSAENIMHPQQSGLPAMISVPLEAMKTIAQVYSQNKGLANTVARLMGHTVPKGVDDFLIGILENDPQKIQGTVSQPNYDPYNVEPQEIPQPRIGERVLTQDIAQQAWELHYLKHWTFRDIAEYLTRDGYPVSHTTVSKYISEIDEEIEEERHSKGRRVRQALLTGAVIIVPSLATALVFHFLRL